MTNASLLRQRQWTSPAFAAGVHTVTVVHAASMYYYADVDAITGTKTSGVSPSGTMSETSEV